MKITKNELKEMIREAINEALAEFDAPASLSIEIPSPWNKYYELAENQDITDGGDMACNNGYEECKHIAFVRLKDEYFDKGFEDYELGELVTCDEKVMLAFVYGYGSDSTRCILYSFDEVENAIKNKHESLNESSKKDDIDADRDDKVEKAKAEFDKKRDDADADKDYEMKKAKLKESNGKLNPAQDSFLNYLISSYTNDKSEDELKDFLRDLHNDPKDKLHTIYFDDADLNNIKIPEEVIKKYAEDPHNITAEEDEKIFDEYILTDEFVKVVLETYEDLLSYLSESLNESFKPNDLKLEIQKLLPDYYSVVVLKDSHSAIELDGFEHVDEYGEINSPDVKYQAEGYAIILPSYRYAQVLDNYGDDEVSAFMEAEAQDYTDGFRYFYVNLSEPEFIAYEDYTYPNNLHDVNIKYDNVKDMARDIVDKFNKD